MPPCAADRLDEMFVRLLTVWLRRLETAPSSERWMFTVIMALSMALIVTRASSALATEVTGAVGTSTATVVVLSPDPLSVSLSDPLSSAATA